MPIGNAGKLMLFQLWVVKLITDIVPSGELFHDKFQRHAVKLEDAVNPRRVRGCVCGLLNNLPFIFMVDNLFVGFQHIGFTFVGCIRNTAFR